VKAGNALVTHCAPHLLDYRLRSLVDVRGSESEKAEAAIQQSILASIVFYEVVPVGAAVVLQAEFVLRVIEIGAAKKAAVLIVESDLGAWAGQASHNQKHPQPRFHGRFGRGLSQFDRAAQSGDALGSAVRFGE
jgi:hypothetical protein